jgi:hypothetical protein
MAKKKSTPKWTPTPEPVTVWVVVSRQTRAPVGVFDNEEQARKYAKQIGGGVSAPLKLNEEAI